MSTAVKGLLTGPLELVLFYFFYIFYIKAILNSNIQQTCQKSVGADVFSASEITAFSVATTMVQLTFLVNIVNMWPIFLFLPIIFENWFCGPDREPFSASILAVDDILYYSKYSSCQGLHYHCTYFKAMTNNALLITSTWLTNVILLLLLSILLNF